MDSLRLASSAVALSLLLSACKGPAADASSNATSGSTSHSTVIAKVGDGTITTDELKARLNEQPPFIRARYNTLERKKEFLDQLIRSELLAQEARRQGLDKDPEVQAMFERLMVQRLLQKHATNAANTPAGEEALKKYYQDHLSEFVRPERVRVSQVFLAAPKGDARREQVRKEAVKLLADARRRESASERTAFADLVARRSEDASSRATGGDLGYKSREELTAQWGAEFATSAFGLKEGELAEVATERGIHLIKLNGRQQAVEQSFETAKPRIESRLQMERRTRAVDELVAALKQKAPIEINDEALKAVEVGGTDPVTGPGPTPSPAQQAHPAAQR